VTISTVRLDSQLNDTGGITEQRIGQIDISLSVQAPQVTDDDPLTITPQSVVVSAAQGAVVSSDTGEQVMIGAGALKNDTAVSIRRINVNEVETSTGLPLPAQGVLETVGAFKLHVASSGGNYPLQFAIPVQNSVSMQAGEEVLFLRKGVVLTQDGTYQPTWWIVDNGFIGSDGVARTASPPYDGVTLPTHPGIEGFDGEYVIAKPYPGDAFGGLLGTFSLGAGELCRLAA
jgi:hypothetical protein